MADEEESKNSKPPAAPPPKKKKSRIGLIIAIVVGFIAASAGGALAGPMVVRKFHPPASGKPAPKPVEKVPETVGLTSNFEAIVIDLYDKDKVLHHLKVGLTAELHDGVAPDEFVRYMPRGREAAISYLRALPFEQATEPSEFAKVREHLSEAVRGAVGHERVVRIVVTDFVAQ